MLPWDYIPHPLTAKVCKPTDYRVSERTYNLNLCTCKKKHMSDDQTHVARGEARYKGN